MYYTTAHQHLSEYLQSNFGIDWACTITDKAQTAIINSLTRSYKNGAISLEYFGNNVAETITGKYYWEL